MKYVILFGFGFLGGAVISAVFTGKLKALVVGLLEKTATKMQGK